MTTHVPVLVTLDLKVHADKRTSNTSVQNNKYSYENTQMLNEYFCIFLFSLRCMYLLISKALGIYTHIYIYNSLG